MAYAYATDEVATATAGVVWSTRRAHLVVVAPVQRPRTTPQQYRRRRRVVGAVAALCTTGLVLTVATWADRQVREPLGDPRPAISLSPPVDLSASNLGA